MDWSELLLLIKQEIPYRPKHLISANCPMPFFLVPSAIRNTITILLQKFVATLVCDANLLPVGQTHSTTPRELAIKTTDEIFQYLARDKQTGIERFIRKNIFGRISSFWKEKQFSPVRLENQTLQISYKDNLAKEQFLEWLEDAKRTNFSDEKVDEKQMLLFNEEANVANNNPPPAP